MKDKWISVSEGLPDYSGSFLVRTVRNDTQVADYHTANYMMDDRCVRQWYLQRTDFEITITHWMPLPPPPTI